jgi:predicted alpha/beta hydrolase family esterase
MSTIVVSHAYASDEHSVWYPYLRDQLHSLGHTVDIPNLPDAHAPDPEQWRTALAERALAAPAEETVLVGHSIGAVNVLRFLESHDAERDGAFVGVVLVAAPAYEVGYEVLAGFFGKPFDWAAIRRGAQRFHVLAAADDPVLIPDPFGHAASFVTNLGATAVITPAGGHFGAAPDDRIDLPEAVRIVLDTLGTR